jgi:hypothetical protein
VSALRFLITFAVVAVVVASAIVGINGLIDPLGVVPLSPSMPSLNAIKVMRFNNDRIYKPLDVRSVQPRTVVLGTSRILQAFDPGTLSETPYAPAYNYGLAGGDLNELEAHFEQFIAPTPSVRYIFVELFLSAAPGERPTRRPPELLFATFFSSSALQQSAETVWQNMRDRAGHKPPDPVVLPDGRQSFVSVSTIGNFLAYPAEFLRKRPRYDVNSWIRGSMRRMRDVAQRRGIAVTFFISPMHAVQLYKLYSTGDWPVLEDWKRQLSREFDVIDFSAYTPITEEPVSSEMRYWTDPHHFSTLTASLLAERFVRGATEPADGFGVTLASDRLDDQLTVWRAARDLWIARNPGWIELFRRGSGGADAILQTTERIPGSESCPVSIAPTLLARLVPSGRSNLWLVSSHRTSLDRPIVIGVRTTHTPGRHADTACELAIDAAPENPSVRPVEWRIGHPMGSPAALRGHTIRYTLEARTTAPLTLSTGSVYVDDGARASVVPLTVLTPEWHTVTVEHTVSPGASRLEAWFRIVSEHGTVRPVGTRVYFKAHVDLAGPAS